MKYWQGQFGGIAALVLLACGGTVDLKAEGAAGRWNRERRYVH